MRVKIKNPIFGVPVTFLQKYDENQFIIVWQANGNISTEPQNITESVGYKKFKEDKGGIPLVKGSRVYIRCLIRKR